MPTQTDDLQGVEELLDTLAQNNDGSVEEHTRDGMALLRVGFAELSDMGQIKEFPEFFLRLARRTGLRLVLLKRWTSGLQVFLEENIQLPEEAKKKRRDGKAPIPSNEEDIFQALSEDATVYAGPVPVKHFPLDLTLMLGRGSRDRRIIILPCRHKTTGTRSSIWMRTRKRKNSWPWPKSWPTSPWRGCA